MNGYQGKGTRRLGCRGSGTATVEAFTQVIALVSMDVDVHFPTSKSTTHIYNPTHSLLTIRLFRDVIDGILHARSGHWGLNTELLDHRNNHQKTWLPCALGLWGLKPHTRPRNSFSQTSLCCKKSAAYSTSETRLEVGRNGRIEKWIKLLIGGGRGKGRFWPRGLRGRERWPLMRTGGSLVCPNWIVGFYDCDVGGTNR